MTNLLFDFDGTLHNSVIIYAPAFRKAYQYLVDKRLADYREWSDDEISSWLGYSSKDMWKAFMPELPDEDKKICSRIIGEEMVSAMQTGCAQLYDGAVEVLQLLKEEGFRLIFLSNCKISYMQESIRLFSLDKYFSAFYCTEEFVFAPKHEIFRNIAQKHDGDFIIIGDRNVDIQIAEMNRLPSIGCRYGYGNSEELKNATIIVCSPREISAAVRHLKPKDPSLKSTNP